MVNTFSGRVELTMLVTAFSCVRPNVEESISYSPERYYAIPTEYKLEVRTIFLEKCGKHISDSEIYLLYKDEFTVEKIDYSIKKDKTFCI